MQICFEFIIFWFIFIFLGKLLRPSEDKTLGRLWAKIIFEKIWYVLSPYNQRSVIITIHPPHHAGWNQIWEKEEKEDGRGYRPIVSSVFIHGRSFLIIGRPKCGNCRSFETKFGLRHNNDTNCSRPISPSNIRFHCTYYQQRVITRRSSAFG